MTIKLVHLMASPDQTVCGLTARDALVAYRPDAPYCPRCLPRVGDAAPFNPSGDWEDEFDEP